MNLFPTFLLSVELHSLCLPGFRLSRFLLLEFLSPLTGFRLRLAVEMPNFLSLAVVVMEQFCCSGLYLRIELSSYCSHSIGIVQELLGRASISCVPSTPQQPVLSLNTCFGSPLADEEFGDGFALKSSGCSPVVSLGLGESLIEGLMGAAGVSEVGVGADDTC